MTYKQVRITEDYLEKLRKLSENQKRSMTKVLEVLIDGAS
jgi:mRNA-degrading endonuclease RelE of RelBE toxin-antitoxin system